MADGGFRELDLRIAYTTADDPLRTFYIPVLSRAVRYDRAAGFFSSGALAVAAQGLAHLVANGGQMRLAVGAALSAEDVEAIRRGSDVEAVTRERLLALFREPEDEVARKRLEALAYMIASGTLEVRVVLPKGPDGRPLPAPDAESYFHIKWGILTDAFGDRVAFSGSINETPAAWQRNFEDFAVYRSWVGGDSPHHVARLAKNFERVWQNEESDWICLAVPEAVRQRLLAYRPAEPPLRDPLERPSEPSPAPDVLAREGAIAAFLRDVPNLLDVGDRVGRATAAIRPWPHQLRVASQVVGSFPERYLLADEVGLGKTVEAGLVLRDLLVSGAVARCLVLAPASVLRQWQDELAEKFALEVEIWNGARFVGPGPDRREREPAGSNPFDEVGVVLVSSQLVKRRDRRDLLLAAADWDLVIVDEAHHARRKGFQDLAARRPNRLLELLEGVDGQPGLAAKTAGLLLLTATPMQVHPAEVWDLLVQLGLPGSWGASEYHFLRYFRELEIARAAPEDADWRFLAALARDELQVGGPIDRVVEASLLGRLDPVSRTRIESFLSAKNPQSIVRELTPQEREGLVSLLRHLTPLRRRMFRHTRNLLRRYHERGLLAERVADRDPEERWIEMSAEERRLYERVEEYISHFYRKYEAERKGLGFVMTVYRRRLTSSFAAITKSLERRLAYLSGVAPDLGLTDEDLEEADLAEDVAEDVPQDDRRRLRRVHDEEVRYVSTFLAELKTLATDTKFRQLLSDLDRALSRRDQVVVFTQYTDTLDDLKERLRPLYGRQMACYSGRGGERWTGFAWAPAGKEEVKNAFKAGEIRVLLGTDALAEGLNLQTCGVEINYDAPWNPMRLEQRIGRIDRIGQRHERLWIWTYFYEGTVEADVYRRLRDRIGSFEGIIGPLQPILARVERTISDLAVQPAAERQRLLEERLRSLDEEIEAARASGLDLETYVPAEPEVVPTPEQPVSPAELEAFLTRSQVAGSRFRPHETVEGAYRVEVGGIDHGATFDAAVADAHPESVRLLTFGDRVLEELLELVGRRRSPTGRLIRAEGSVTAPPGSRRFVGWYARVDGELRRIERLGDLLTAIEQGALVDDALRKEVEGAFALDVIHWQEAQQAAAIRRAQERLSSLIARGRDVLARATLVWIARHSEGDAPLDLVRPETVTRMTTRERYPFAPLAVEVAPVDAIIFEPDVMEELAGRTKSQLDGTWQALRTEVAGLLFEVLRAKEAVKAAKADLPRPVVSVTVH